VRHRFKQGIPTEQQKLFREHRYFGTAVVHPDKLPALFAAGASSLAEAADNWCVIPAALLASSAFKGQLEWAAQRASRWAAAGKQQNTLRRHLAKSKVLRLVGVIATDRAVQRLSTGAVRVDTLPKEILLPQVIRDVHHGELVHWFGIVTTNNSERSGTYLIAVVYSVHQQPPTGDRRQAGEHIKGVDAGGQCKVH
jgi:hypothetical protein